MSAIKLILIIVLAILIASFVGCVGSMIFTGAVIKGISDTVSEKHQIQTTKTPPLTTQKNALENQQKAMKDWQQSQRQIQLNRPMEQPSKNYIEINGKRIAIQPKSKPAQIEKLTRQDIIDYRTKALHNQ